MVTTDNVPMSVPGWLQQRERSSLFWLRTIVWIALTIGRPFARLLLYPITAYFLVFSRNARCASRRYLAKVFGFPVRWSQIFRHYHTFAETILDRVFVYSGRHSIFKLDVHGFSLLEDCLTTGRGCILVGAHIGSVDLLRTMGMLERGLSIRALMYPENASRILQMFRTMNPELCADIIALGRPQSLVDVQEALDAGSFVALLGDRCLRHEKRLRCRFLGEPAWFPEAPVRLARLFGVPLVMFACLHRGDAEYEVRFELLEDFRQAAPASPGTVLQRYAEALERLCHSAPYNWFNFYEFWDHQPAER
jgi:predicted LPLAT superfamily acyltransferase